MIYFFSSSSNYVQLSGVYPPLGALDDMGYM